jgi:hypothetical protein
VKEFSVFLCLNSPKIPICVFPKEKTSKPKGEIKTHQRRKNWKVKKSKQPKQKQICTKGAYENLMQQIPWETERK